MAPKAPQLIQHYVTGGDRSLKSWHNFLRQVTFGAALVLMSASIVSLHWACNLIGLNGPWEPVAWLVPLAMEFGMAAVASTATTIRKPPKAGQEHGGYYVSLWIIFSFVMLLAQVSNIGHAVTTVAQNPDLPPVIPVELIYGFAAAFAALFPLGGTLFVHVSGFLRERGTGARWIEEDAEVVYVQAQPGVPAAQRATPARTQAAPAARTEPAQPARTTPPAERAPRAQAPTTRASEGQAEARAVFDQMVTENPGTKPNAAEVHRRSGVTRDSATVRRWVNDKWWPEHEAALGMTRPEPRLSGVPEQREDAAAS